MKLTENSCSTECQTCHARLDRRAREHRAARTRIWSVADVFVRLKNIFACYLGMANLQSHSELCEQTDDLSALNYGKNDE
jgi:hypothetical protein